MNIPHVRLTLVFPPSLESAISEALITAPQSPGFTLFRAQGHSSDFPHASTAEQVRGYVERGVIWIVTPAEAVAGVLAALREKVASREVMWWTEAVLEQGRLA